MSMALEDVTRQAIDLPRHQRLALTRLLIELDGPGSDADVEDAWEAEIQARLRAVKEGRSEGIPYEQVLVRVDRRLASCHKPWAEMRTGDHQKSALAI